MTAGINAGGGCSRRSAASGGSRPWDRRAALGTLGGFLFVLCAGCSSSREIVPATMSSDTPLMTDRLLLKPVDRGRLSSTYGMRFNPILKQRQMHRGIDWAAPRGTTVRAAGDGVVVAAGRLGSYGHYVRIDHGGGVATAYAHLHGYARGLGPGRPVRRGDAIAAVGSTGRATAPHLHYEILVAGRQVDPLAVPSPMAAHDPDPSVRVTPASLPSAPAWSEGALAAGDVPGWILVEDLLRAYGPCGSGRRSARGCASAP
jgi:murein DD-endopeptidase MepM/ murein hydrolase activator NlpD